MKIDFKSLKFKNFIYLIYFSILILVMLWVLQIIFFKNYYQMMRAKEIEKIGNNIVKNFDSGDIVDKLKYYAFNNNVSINIFDETGDSLVNLDSFSAYRNDFSKRQKMPPDEFINIKNELTSSGLKSSSYIRGEKDKVTISYATNFESKNKNLFLVLSTPSPPVDSTISVLKNQLFIITIFLFLLSIFLANIITKKLTVPIINLTSSAKKLANGNFDISFEDSGFTEINELSKTLSYATKELSMLDAYRKEFMANVSHDLKTPLTIIKFYSELIRDVSGDLKEKRISHCDLIISETDRLTELVNEILELSKLQSGNNIINKTNFNLSEDLFEILERFKVLSEKENYLFNTEIENDLTVFADENLIKRAIYNLIGNAVNYTGLDKTVDVKLFKTTHGKIRFEVSDTGKGISESEISNIWERYYKTKENHVRSVIGTGLGLPIVKNILLSHNANYGVKSSDNIGSTFWFEL